MGKVKAFTNINLKDVLKYQFPMGKVKALFLVF